MEKIAIISDIHGNLESLKAVLADIKTRDVNQIICLGDVIAKGSNPQQCIEIIKKHCDLVLRGNNDEYFTNNIDLSNKPQSEIDKIKWIKSKISPENAEYLRNLPYSFEFYLSGRLVRLFHATPEKIDEYVGNIDSIDRLYALFLPSKNTISKQVADIVIYGHTHTQNLQRIYNRTIINTGSVGNSLDILRDDKRDGNVKNTTVANYLIISGNYNSKNIDTKISYEFISIPYDINKELQSSTDNAEMSSYEAEIRTGKYRNMAAVYRELKARGIDKI